VVANVTAMSELLLLNMNKKTKMYTLNMERQILKQVNKNEFQLSNGPVIIIKKDIKIKLVNGKKKNITKYLPTFDSIFTGEGMINLMYSAYQGCKTLMSATNNMLKHSSSVHLQALILDASSLILQHGSGTYNNWTPAFLVGFLARVYSIFMRTKEMIKPTGESLDSLMIMGASIGLPESVFSVLKRMALLTNKKIGDHPGLCLDVIQSISEYLLSLCLKATWLPLNVVEFLTKIFSFGAIQRINYRMKILIEEWKQDKRVMLDKTFRDKINLVKKDIDSNPDTPYRLSTMINFKNDYQVLERMVKGSLALEKCSRQEPVCIVLEGPAGTKKSIVMLQVLKLLQRSYYTHIVKSTDDGKDHYDGYNNEDVFVMDDLGQQGVSQWRTIINMVSAVKMPLECASVDLKDTKYFDSKIILITTNRFSDLEGTLTKTDCISEITALFRRAQVFNFTDSENVSFKRFDIMTNRWTTKFLHDTTIPGMKRGNSFDIAVWITALTEQMEEYYNRINSCIELSQSQVQIGRDMIDQLKFESYSDCIQENLISGVLSRNLDMITVTETLEDIMNCIVNHLTKYSNYYLFGALALVSYGVYHTISNFIMEEQIELDGITVVNEWNKALQYKSKNVKLIEGQVLLAEGTTDTMIETVKKNVKILKIMKSDGEYEITHALVSGTKILLPAHTIYESRKTLILYNSQEDFVQENRALDNCKFKIIMEDRINDIAILEVPLLNNTPYKNLSHLFKHVDKPSANLFFVWSGDPVELSGTVKPMKENPMYLTKFGQVFPKDVLTYEMTSKGFCGSIVVDKQTGIQGFHVAGDQKNLGIAKIFSQSIKSKIGGILKDGIDSEMILEATTKENKFSGMVSPSRRISDGPSKTHYRRSEFYGTFDSTKMPADLRALGDKTVKLRAKRMHKIVTTLNIKELEFMSKFLDWILPNFEVIPELEVVKGNEFLAPLNKDSVSGMDFPKDKREYFDFETGEIEEEFLSDLEKFRQECQIKYPSKITQHHTLKDELRLLNKVQKPRTFGVDSLLTQFEMKRLMGNLFIKIRKRSWENGVAIGLNPYKDWSTLYKNLSQCDRVWDGDIGEWDASVSPEIQDLLNEKIQRKFVGTIEDRIVLQRILELSVRSWVVAGNKTMYKTHGILSGMWITNLFNSIINRCYTAGWFYRQYYKTYNEEPTVAKFLSTIVDYAQGDDKITGTKFLHSNFTAKTMRDYYESVGMSFTDGEKGNITFDGKSIFDCSFLKRKFYFHDKLNEMVGYITPETITNTIMWYKNDNDEEEIMQDKVSVFQREAFLMPIEIRQELMTRLLENMTEKGMKYKLLSEEYLMNLYREDPDYLYQHTKQTQGKFY